MVPADGMWANSAPPNDDANVLVQEGSSCAEDKGEAAFDVLRPESDSPSLGAM